MNKLVSFLTLFISLDIVYVSSHLERPGKFLDHDRTVVDCAKYKREANQHKCVLAPYTTEGPYFLPDDFERSDITDGQTGVNLDLNLKLTNAKDCSPLSNYFVHIWQANPMGHYSGVQEFNVFPEPSFRPKPVTDSRFLRGYQRTDKDGKVNFKTIIPGWYFGRCIHIHVEVYGQNTTDGNAINYIGQLYFDRELPEQLKLVEPYSENRNQLTLNDYDFVYFFSNGSDTTLDLAQKDDGFQAEYIVAINPDVTVKYDDVWL
uniref:Intradiol dioxygenase isoform X2 n=1 Tax=Tetranychus evansi TaxID=178897 RepID=A0A3G5AQ25_9ACAR|nr:intradiol dioxygenase isoform X2 [Tetranychus evansi]